MTKIDINGVMLLLYRLSRITTIPYHMGTWTALIYPC